MARTNKFLKDLKKSTLDVVDKHTDEIVKEVNSWLSEVLGGIISVENKKKDVSIRIKKDVKRKSKKNTRRRNKRTR